MSLLNRLRDIFRRPAPRPEAPAPAPDPDVERRRAFFRFLELDPLLAPEQGPLHAAVVLGAFSDVLMRIVARHGEAETLVEVEALDVTTRPVEPRHGDFEYLDRLAREARIVHERAVVSPEALARFRQELGPDGGFELADAHSSGFDGYMFRAAVSDGQGRTHRFSASRPAAESPHFRFLRALHALASESLQGWRALSALDSLHRYAGLGERFRDFGGSPRLVRLWGDADSAADGLAHVERLRRLPDTEPIILDLRWFRSPRVVLEAALRWGAERPNVRVVVPLPDSHTGDAAKRAQLPAERTFQRLDDALDAPSSRG
ncbi:hypothetical protein ACLESD_26145 [Pyxidicoccus sp. 3LFB2]